MARAVGWRLVGAVAVVAALGAAPLPGAAGCPPGLEEAAEAYRQAMNREQAQIRASTRESPRGVEATMVFDRASHGCHRAPGQAYREFGPPECLEPRQGRRVAVRFPYRLFFRKALTLEELFERDWEPGSDGILQVIFEREGERWVPVARREVLDLGDKGNSRDAGGTRGGRGRPSP